MVVDFQIIANIGGECDPSRNYCSHNGECSSESITLADHARGNVPLGALHCLVVEFCPKHSAGFQVTHDGVDGPFVALGIESHSSNHL